MPLKTDRAFTLLEVTVACAIALVLSAVCARFFHASLVWQARSLRKIHLQQQLNVAVARISADLQRSAPGGVAAAPNQLAIQQLVDISTERPARTLWDTVLGIYFVNAQGLCRRNWPPQPPDLGVTVTTAAPFRPDSSQLNLLCQPVNANRLGRNVTLLQLSDPSTLPLRLTVTVAEQQDLYTTTRVLSMRNAE